LTLPALAFSVPACEMTAVAQRAGVVTMTAHTTAPTASGPHCGISSRRMHRDDTRRPRELPLGDFVVRVVVRVRRLRGLNATCTTQTFAAR